jgi:hypothetical protein
MALTVALIDRTGALDTNFNGTGQLINTDCGEAVLAGVMSTHVGNNDGPATDLDIVYGTVGSAAAQFVDWPITNGIPDHTNPTVTNTGTFTGLQGSASQTTRLSHGNASSL